MSRTTVLEPTLPRRDLDQHFDAERREWTERKHQLLKRVVTPSAEKMKLLGGLALVDGYAGPNLYGGTVQGSTVILTGIARRLRQNGHDVRVYACESDPERYAQLIENLDKDVNVGTLQAYSSSHTDALADIRARIGNLPAIVFLDPHGPKDMLLEDDLRPWLSRPKTDVLGIFMGVAAARVCSSAKVGGSPKTTAEAIMGPRWKEVASEQDAYRIFFSAIGGYKRYTGLYPLRKRDVKHTAYAVFGVSDKVDGFWLLSDAVARDWGYLKEFDFTRTRAHLFTSMEREDDQRQQFEDLIGIVKPVLVNEPRLTGQKLALRVLERTDQPSSIFGRYKESDFTKAAQALRKEARDG